MGPASFDIGAFFVCLTCLVYMHWHGRRGKLQSKVLLAMIIDLALTAASNAAAALIRAYAVASAASVAAVEVAGFLYFVTHAALAPLFALYVMMVCGSTASQHAVSSIIMGIPFVALELLAITNPITHWVFSYGPDLTYYRGWAGYVFYAVGMFYLVLGFVQLVRRWRALTPVKRRALGFFFLMAIAGVVVQLVVPELRIEMFAESLAVLGVLMFVENEDEIIDSETGVYHRQALEMDLDTYTSQRDPFYIVAVRVLNADAFSRLGKVNLTTGALGGMMAEYFKSVVPWYRIYRTAPTRFVLIDPSMNEEKAFKCARIVSDRFLKSWTYSDMEVDMRAVVALARVPKDLRTAEDVFYLVDTPVPPVAEGVVLQGEGLNYLMRRAEVERAVHCGFEENGYEVYYQPVVRPDGTVRSAEALMRLTDSQLGSVSPIEFIEAAERLKLIDGIGDIALRQVCEFLQSGVPQQLGIESINVNLSIIECMQTDFVERVRKTVAEYGVDPHAVGFEITESLASSDYDFLKHAVAKLRSDGHLFAMDDFGTGYSNMHSLLTLDFDVAKIDKSVLWDAEKSNVGMAVLEYSVGLLRSIGSKVLVEGVETESQLGLLQRLNVDYYQGFYYAQPMPKNEFVAYVEQHRV